MDIDNRIPTEMESVHRDYHRKAPQRTSSFHGNCVIFELYMHRARHLRGVFCTSVILANKLYREPHNSHYSHHPHREYNHQSGMGVRLPLSYYDGSSWHSRIMSKNESPRLYRVIVANIESRVANTVSYFIFWWMLLSLLLGSIFRFLRAYSRDLELGDCYSDIRVRTHGHSRAL